MIVIQFNLKTTLFTEGKKFFEAIKKKSILDFIDNLEKKEYDKALDISERRPEICCCNGKYSQTVS